MFSETTHDTLRNEKTVTINGHFGAVTVRYVKRNVETGKASHCIAGMVFPGTYFCYSQTRREGLPRHGK